MIEELKQILELVKELPHLVMWVLAGLLLYKVVVIGSVFGIIKLAINKFHDFLTAEKKITYKFRDVLVNTYAEELLYKFLTRVRSTSYLHTHDVVEIEKAWDQYKKKT